MDTQGTGGLFVSLHVIKSTTGSSEKSAHELMNLVKALRSFTAVQSNAKMFLIRAEVIESNVKSSDS